MNATAPQGFMYLNAAGVWPKFVFQDVVINSSGGLQLTTSGAGFASTGVFMGGPFQALDGNTPWYRFSLKRNVLPSGTHMQMFTWTGPKGATPPYAPLSNVPFPGWSFAPFDSTEGVIFNDAAPNLWVGGVLRSDGTASPSIQQIRIDYGRDTYLKFLPAIYRSDPSSRDLLERLLSLTQTGLGDLRHEIVHLTQLFDPEAVPDQGYPSWLAWLSGWLAWQLNDNWTEDEARRYLSEAFELYSLRGTVEGLRRYLKIYAGVNAYIYEPALSTTVWSLGQNSCLGFTTMLAPASASGTILDFTAFLDASDLTNPADTFGAALFGNDAYCFYVVINAGELTRPGALETVRAVVAREKPAHTVCQICVVPARMSVGSQCRIGIDTVVGKPREARIGGLLRNAVLAASARECNEKEVSHAA